MPCAAAIDDVGLADRADEEVASLSGGQQRRVLIARALAGRPDLLVMDEPTAGVDHASQEALAEVLRSLAGPRHLDARRHPRARRPRGRRHPHRVHGVRARRLRRDPAAYAAHLAAHATGSGHHHDGPDAAARPAAVHRRGSRSTRPRGCAVTDLLALDFMRQALLAALLAGLAAPLVGVFLVQRRMSLIGDGMGHVALAGVAVGVLTGQQPVLTALVAAVARRGRHRADPRLGAHERRRRARRDVLRRHRPRRRAHRAVDGGTPANLTAYLFGAILTTSSGDIVVFAVLAAVVLVHDPGAPRTRFFAVANDEEYARAAGHAGRSATTSCSRCSRR